jgi:imidazolonepropionase-like amidohydrolase
MPRPAGPSRSPLSHRRAGAALLLVALATVCAAPALAATPRVHAIRNARIVTSPGHVIARGNVVMRDGIITAVGADVAIPADARVWEGDSLTVYAGMIDAFVMPAAATGPAAGGPSGGGRPGGQPAAPEALKGAVHELPSVRAEYRAVENLPVDAAQAEALRAAGFTAVQLSPRQGIVRGSSAVVGLGMTGANASVVRSDAAMVMALAPNRGNQYPGSLMGAISVLRQVFLDAKWYRDVRAAAAKRTTSERVPENLAWAALQPVISGQQNVLMVADEMLEVLQASKIASEAGVAATIVTAGDEYKRVAQVAATGRSFVVPVNFPDPPDVSDDANALEVRTEELRHWQAAPSNPATLAKAGVTFALTANGLKDVKTFRGMVAKALSHGLSEDQALAAVTTTPAKLLGVVGKLGVIAPGAIANLTVTRGPLFGETSKVREVWVDGNRYEAAKDETTPKGEWSFSAGGRNGTLSVKVDKDTTVTLVMNADTAKAVGVQLEDKRVRFTVPIAGQAQAWDLKAANDALTGTANEGTKSIAVNAAPKPKDDKAGAKKPDAAVPVPVVMGNSEAWRMAKPVQPATVLVKNATVWTSGPAGILTNADLLVKNGKVAAVGKNLSAPANAVVIDGTGKHVAPGVIDEHSHSAILGNVNECTNSVTCEVRIQDVINSESVNLYRQLAGGGTMMHLLHGSCNSIGGQCAVIKNKWGAPPDELFYTLAPGTVKFALGENPKQANFGPDRTNRYPKTRAGVEQTIREAFARAQDYERAFAEFKSGKRALPPRRDLQLEALSEIINGKRYIHCHSYRQDEILMLMRLTESFGIRVNTFTHILEGYKVADEMAAHGASGMGFTDWWGYKQEVIDAIPWNGYLMWDRGVNVGFNSDDDELARRLNTEAAKAIKYGGVPREEALKMVTLNPAKSLKIDQYVGSLEPGKDADFALWSGEPLSPYSVCEQTWIEGRKYFDRAADLAGREALAQERAALIAAAKAAKKDTGAPMAGRGTFPPRYLEDTDQSGNDCGAHAGHAMPFLGEADRKAKQSGEEGSR